MIAEIKIKDGFPLDPRVDNPEHIKRILKSIGLCEHWMPVQFNETITEKQVSEQQYVLKMLEIQGNYSRQISKGDISKEIIESSYCPGMY